MQVDLGWNPCRRMKKITTRIHPRVEYEIRGVAWRGASSPQPVLGGGGGWGDGKIHGEVDNEPRGPAPFRLCVPSSPPATPIPAFSAIPSPLLRGISPCVLLSSNPFSNLTGFTGLRKSHRRAEVIGIAVWESTVSFSRVSG